MIKYAPILCFWFCTVALVPAQEAPNPFERSAAQAPTQAAYVIQITEYRLKTPLDPARPVAEILEMLAKPADSSGHQPIETVRLSALDGIESSVQFGRRVSVAVGNMVVNRGGMVKNYQSVEEGTIARITAVSKSDKVEIALDYESSRIEGDPSGDSPPDVSMTKIRSTQLLEPGKPSLLGSDSAESTAVIVITVTRN